MRQSEVIKSREFISQQVGFDGLQFGLCRPTDIDLSIDFQGKCFIFVELKTGSAPLTVGQRIHLSSLVDAIRAGGKPAFAIHASNVQPECGGDIFAAESEVVQVYDGAEGPKGKWKRIHDTTLLDMMTQIHFDYKKGNL